MKKQILLSTAIIFSTIGFCQNQSEENKLRFGIKAGIAIADNQYQNNLSSSNHGFKAGGMGGVFARTHLSNSFYFQPELLMVGKGTKLKNEYYDNRLDLTYIELPLNLLYQSLNPKARFFLGGGPDPSVLIGENIFYSGYKNSKSFDLGINILAGFELPIGFSINLNYTHGLLNVTADKEHIPMIKNRSFGFTVGYMFK